MDFLPLLAIEILCDVRQVFQIILVTAGKEYPAIVSCMPFTVSKMGALSAVTEFLGYDSMNISDGMQYWAHQEKRPVPNCEV